MCKRGLESARVFTCSEIINSAGQVFFQTSLFFKEAPVFLTLMTLKLVFKDLPVKRDSCQCEDTGNDCVISNKIIDCTIDRSKWPVIVPHIDKVEETIENGHQKVCQGQVHQEVIRRCPHSFVTLK